MIRFRKAAMAVAISSSLLLAACGGGGGSSSKGGGDHGPALSGTAVKGLLKGATVTAYELDDQGERRGAVGQGTTGDDGRYNLRLNASYQGGPIEIVVLAGAGTTMLCDVVDGCGTTAFGHEMPVSEGFEMTSLTEGAKSGETLEGAVTPWTHMAATRAKKLIEDGTSPSVAATKANAEVSGILGFDIAKTKAADLSAVGASASAEEIKYAAATAALSAILLADPDKVKDKLEELAASFDDGKFDDKDDITIGDIKQNLQKVVTSSHFTAKANEEAANHLSNIVVKLPDEGEYIPPVVDEKLLTGSDVEKFKAFAKQVRTWVGTIQSTDFNTPLEALEIDLETVQQALGDDTVGVTQLLGETLGQVLDYLAAHPGEVQQALNEQSALTVAIQDADAQSLGKITVDVATDHGVTLTLDGAIQGAEESLTISGLTLTTNIPANAFANGVFDSFKSSQVELNLSGNLSSTNVKFALNGVSLKVATSKELTYSETLAGTTFEEAFKSASLAGDMTISHETSSFSGKVAIELVRLGAVQHASTAASIQKFEARGNFTGAKGSFDAAIVLNLSNAATFDTFGFLDHDDMRDVRVTLPVAEFLPESAKPSGGADVVVSMYSAYLSGYERDQLMIYRQDWSAGHDLARRDAYNNCLANPPVSPYGFPSEYDCATAHLIWLDPESVLALSVQETMAIGEKLTQAIQAKYPAAPVEELEWFSSYDFFSSDTDAYWYAWVRFGDFERDDYFLQGSLTLSAGLQLPELPKANITATVHRTKFNGGNLNATVEWNGGSYNLSLTVDDVEAEKVPATLEFSNALGLRLVLETADFNANKVQLSGAAYVGSTKVGNVETSSDGIHLIRYTDGSFETLYW